jgi:hypothetical protein
MMTLVPLVTVLLGFQGNGAEQLAGGAMLQFA